jgi:hypothetical protein
VASALAVPPPEVRAPARLLEFTGAGINAWTAAEGALKTRETSYVATEGLSAEQLLHGPGVALRPGDGLVALDGGGAGSGTGAEMGADGGVTADGAGSGAGGPSASGSASGAAVAWAGTGRGRMKRAQNGGFCTGGGPSGPGAISGGGTAGASSGGGATWGAEASSGAASGATGAPAAACSGGGPAGAGRMKYRRQLWKLGKRGCEAANSTSEASSQAPTITSTIHFAARCAKPTATATARRKSASIAKRIPRREGITPPFLSPVPPSREV